MLFTILASFMDFIVKLIFHRCLHAGMYSIEHWHHGATIVPIPVGICVLIIPAGKQKLHFIVKRV